MFNFLKGGNGCCPKDFSLTPSIMLVTLTLSSGTLTHMYDTQDTYDTTMNYRYTPIIPTNHIHDRNGMIH